MTQEGSNTPPTPPEPRLRLTSDHDPEGISSGERLPDSVQSEIRRLFGAGSPRTPEVPVNIEMAVLDEYRSARRRAATRSQWIRGIQVAAALVFGVTIFMTVAPGPPQKTTTAPPGSGRGGIAASPSDTATHRLGTLAQNRDARVDGADDRGRDAPATLALAPTDAAEAARTREMERTKTGPTPTSPTAPPAPTAAPAAVADAAPAELAQASKALQPPDPKDLDGNGRVDVLDSLTLAIAVRRRQEIVAANQGVGHEPLNAAWDFTGDGVVDRADADAIATLIVRVVTDAGMKIGLAEGGDR